MPIGEIYKIYSRYIFWKQVSLSNIKVSFWNKIVLRTFFYFYILIKRQAGVCLYLYRGQTEEWEHCVHLFRQEEIFIILKNDKMIMTEERFLATVTQCFCSVCLGYNNDIFICHKYQIKQENLLIQIKLIMPFNITIDIYIKYIYI